MFLRFSGKRNDLFMLRGVLRNHWLQTRPATVHFQKALAALFVCHAKSSSTDALRLHHLSASSRYQGLGFLFECFRVTLHPTSFQQRSGEISSQKEADTAPSGVFTKPCILKPIIYI